MRRNSMAWILGGLVVAAPAVAQPTHDHTQRNSGALSTQERALANSLSGLETAPTADDWAKRPADTGPRLAHLIAHKAVPLFVQVRAVSALQFFATDATYAVLRGVAAGDGPPALRREAILSLARAFGARAHGPIAPMIDDASPLVRRGAARALGLLGDGATLTARRRVEKDAGVRHAIDAALAQGPQATDRSPSR